MSFAVPVSHPGVIVGGLILINLLTFSAFWIDKARAIRGGWRIS